ncbi:CpaF family protein [Sulfobacillus sp. hq2]|uniref:CpaF family protein n=1 Tax=Sulfobacillus TaxID=28033 RepID=UPI000CCFF00D|nr:ATPase, T2SS/T4P/T4SS family [Sulfobacillus sp. hq2]POB12311.1 type II secretion system protein E [Sulfobacillus sp. hq2]
MSDINQYLHRPGKAAALRADHSHGSHTAYATYENAAWDWIEAHYPDIMLHKESVATEVVTDTIAQAVAQLKIPSSATRAAVAAKLRSRLIGAGAIDQWMNDPSVTEITVVNTRVRVQRDGRYEVVPPLVSPAEASNLAQFLCDRAGARYQPVNPLQTIMWPGNGARINVVHESVSGNGGPIITIRKRNKQAAFDLADLIDRAMMNDEMADVIIRAIRGKANIVIAGPTNTGKTTVLRAFARAAIPQWERVITIEDIDELQLVDVFPDCVSLVGHEKSDPDSAEPDVSIHALFVNALRMTPDRLIVGEVRGIEAKDVLEAAATEQGGMLFTVHLNRPELLFQRFHSMFMNSGLMLPYEVVEAQVKNALNLIIQINRPANEDGRVTRRVTEIAEVRDDGTIAPLWQWDGTDWLPRNALSDTLARRMALYGNLGDAE